MAAAWAPFQVGAVVPTDANEFSAARARAVLQRLLDDERPHPVGSPANRAVRVRLEAELSALGLDARVQSRVTCGGFGLCARVENVVVEIEGERRTGGIALAAHYDSVPAGPGAGDDGAGVAALLEIARALRAGPRPARSTWLWFTDGEEMGLLGARALVSDPELVRNVDLVVNLEARGTSGPSLMFESSTPNDGIIARFANAVERPVSGSTFYAVYRTLPNDTDLTVFRRAGLAGLNLAFIGGATRYHTPGDSIANLSLRSLQHEGEQALALIRRLAQEGAPPTRRDSVFFDVFGRWFFHASVPVARGLAAGVLVLGLAGLFWYSRRRGLASGRILWAAALPFAVPFVAAVAMFPAHALLAWFGVLDQPWPASMGWILGSGAALTASLMSFTSSSIAARIEVDVAFAGFWAAELAGTVLVGWLLPEALPLFALPALGTTLVATARYFSKPLPADLVLCLPAVVKAALWAPIFALAVLALGVLSPSISCILLALAAGPLLPLLFAWNQHELRAAAKGFGALSAALLVTALVLPASDASAPARVNLAHHVDGTRGEARLLLEGTRVPKPLAETLRFESNEDDPFPWFGATLTASFRAEASVLDLRMPALRVETDRPVGAGRLLELVVTPGASGALALTLAVPQRALGAAFVDGVPILPVVASDLATVGRVSPEGPARFGLELHDREPLPVRVVELHSGLPDATRALARTRDLVATASQTGDLTIASRDETF